ncbi:FtsX-like permease family protein [Nocardioides lijunqiniae]|uniref:FtsX-like permease family protein n=1 Tax=Nocardioides lijunqiniae TaxID=2760832 RepID=UPI00187776E6|nr:FtsX-like permease family protein [Nocardioides lijunqiniae]
MARLARWRPALRMAWRDLLQHPLRTVVVTVLVALPVAAAVVVSTVTATTDYYSPNTTVRFLGAADAALEVTPHPRVRVATLDRGRYVEWTAPRRARDVERDATQVDVAALLPEGSRVTRVGRSVVPLAIGGRLDADVLDLDDPLTRGLAVLESGRAPTSGGEVAVDRLLADELDLLDGDRLAADATLSTLRGDLEVVGVLEPDPDAASEAAPLVLPPVRLDARPDSRSMVRYLVDLPELTSAQGQALQADLAAHGVSAQLRDATEHPDAWGLEEPLPSPVEPTAVAAGALVIGIGLIEVLVLVGSAFAVGARRQTRTLGLVMASGGTPADVRRTVLAQGLWIGVAAAALGTGAGLLSLLLGRDPIASLAGQRLSVYSFSPGTIAAVALLGVASAVAAAAIPAWGVGRMTAAESLDGHVATASRGRRGGRLRGPALALLGSGGIGLTLSGWWISREFAADAATPSTLPVAAGGLSAVVLLLGAILATPFLVDLLGARADRGWLPWRLAVRDVARHRGRTTAAVLGIGIVVTGAVFAGFGVSANAALQEVDEPLVPAGTAELYLSAGQLRDPDALARVRTAAAEIVGAEGLVVAQEARIGRRPVTDNRGGTYSIVDDRFLEVMGLPDSARRDLADGKALVVGPSSLRDGEVRAVVGPRRDRVLDERIPGVQVRPGFLAMPSSVWISTDTADRLGMRGVPMSAFLHADHDLDRESLERLAFHGIHADGDEPQGPVDPRLILGGAGGVLLATCLVVGMIVALSASEGRGDTATLAAVGAPPWTRRATSAGQALAVGSLGAGLGLLLGAAGGASLLQLVGTPGTPVPWAGLAVVVAGVPLLSTAVGWLVTPTRLSLTRRTG